MSDLRNAVVAKAQYVLDHGRYWLYYQDRPIPISAMRKWSGRTQIKTDCSGSAIGIYAMAGAPDPSGDNYNGIGNTDSLYAHCEHVAYEDCLPADLIDVVGADGTEHVYLVMERIGGDLKVFSHGGPLGQPPRSEMLSGVKDYWYGRGFHFQGLREIPTEPQYSWRVLADGVKIASTNHPATWAMRHRKAFRNHVNIRFRRN